MPQATIDTYVLIGVFLCAFNGVHGWVIRHHDLTRNDVENPHPDHPQQRIQMILPGTKWCGSGNMAENYNDLGKYNVTDACCREHDNCDDVIEAGHTKYDLKNPSFYTRLKCDCDTSFWQCLKRSSESISKYVGMIYFNLLGTQCFKKDYPIEKCTAQDKNHCTQYQLNTAANPVYQWFDVPVY